MTHIGADHSGKVTGVKISPDGRFIVSVSDDGAIMRWKFPVFSEETATPAVPALDTTADNTPRPEPTSVQESVISPNPVLAISPNPGPGISPKPESVTSPQPMAASSKQEERKAAGGASSKQGLEEMEVGGATPRQEE